MSVRSLLLGAVVVSGLLVSACNTDAPDPTRTTGHLSTSWQRVPLSGALTPVTLAVDGTTVLVGAHSTQRPHPRLLSGTDATALREVPLTPRSPYAFEGRWFQIISRDGHVDAIAGARGGAHGNYRWTTWSGSRKGVAEQEQPFGVFGSYGAGDLAGMAYAVASPVILGAWQSDRTGLDVATWTRTGERWGRQPSSDTALGSTPDALLDARAITSDDMGLLLAGSVTHLSSGAVSVAPAVWTAPGPTGPWARVDLSRAGDSGTSVVHGAHCVDGHCLLTGVTDGRLSVWDVTRETQGELPGTPVVDIPENGAPLAPLSMESGNVVVTPSDGGSTVLRRSGESWSVGEGPRGTPVSAIVHGNELWLVTMDAQGTGTLWRSRVR